MKVALLRTRGRRLVWRDVVNGPRYTGQLTTHSIEIDGERYAVATLRPTDSTKGELIPELYEPVLLGFSILAFRLRGFERVDSARGAFGAVQEWHCELP
ncbi:MAG: hypothetical protein ABR570_17835 [Burkholderiales bacterium]